MTSKLTAANTCPNCHGSGTIEVYTEPRGWRPATCRVCNGTGKVRKK